MKQQQTVKRTNPWTFAAGIGFFAGLIWGAVRLVEYYFQFTRVSPAYWIKPFVDREWFESNYGYLLGWAAFIVFSVLVALLYAALLRKRKGPWPGLAYGLVWWLVLFVLAGPMLGMVEPVYRLDLNSIVTDLCLYAVWGMFIGYSISIEFTDERIREPFTYLHEKPSK